ncbi:discoidin domain-containing protein [Dactylosporangium sp. CA-092794]|uniref:discoidin domain-containing protein n=1 Tax=Dactylosporangium sp. CA-092794 TaxID=3239929 RepID=UPI003D8E1970
MRLLRTGAGRVRMPRPDRWPRIVAVVAAAGVVATIAIWVVARLAGPADAGATSPFDVPQGVGAGVPFVEYEAEDAATDGTVIGPGYAQGALESEATGRRAVRLTAAGQYVEFTLTKAANAVDVRYNVPRGGSGALSVSLNGQPVDARLDLTARYTYLDTPNIGGSKTHHLFDDVRTLLGRRAGPGDKVRLTAQAGSLPYTVDLADFEDVADPAAAPADAVSVVDAGADRTGAADSTAAFNKAIADASARGGQVWIPPGDYAVNGPLTIDKVTVRGAGPWYSVIHGKRIIDNQASTGPIKLYDFAVFGDVTTRDDGSPDNFVNGSLGNGSVVSNIWMQHLKVGLWLMGPNNTGLTIEGNRILDTTADGINFNGTVTGSVVRDTYVRNTGDDGLAMWSLHAENKNDTFANNTVVQPNLANGIAIYGGTDIALSKNVVADTNGLGSGIAVSNQQFIAGQGFTPLAGTIDLADNVLIRAGAMNPNWNHPMGAIRFDSYDSAIDGVRIKVTGTRIIASPYSAFEVVSGGGLGLPVNGLTVDGATVQGVGTVVLQVEAKGSGTFTGVHADGVGRAGVYDCPYPAGSGTFARAGSGNSGWDTAWEGCAAWPDAVLPDDAATAPAPAPTTRAPATTSATTAPPTRPATSAPATVGPSTKAPGPTGNLARGAAVTATSVVQDYQARNAVDGDPATYWESANHAFPQVFTVDLGAPRDVRRVVLKLPPSPAWGPRTQTVSIMASRDGVDYANVAGSQRVAFDPATGNTATVGVEAAGARFLLVLFTANTGWPGAQLSEFEVYGG